MVREVEGIISSSMIGKIIMLEEGRFYIDIAKNPLIRNQKVFIFIDESGKVDVVFENMKFKNKYKIKSETEGIPPPQILRTADEIVQTPSIDLEKAFEIGRDVIEKTVVFKEKKIYDLVTSWCMWTWVRGFFPKNINLYFTGFPATGKSQALKFCKHFARYMTDYDPSSEKSYKWTISHTLGTLGIDEAEYISKIQASKMRKYHETGVIESRMIGLPLVGLTMIELRVDCPIVVSATHLPPDMAFLQRGFLIRMYKGKPKVKDFDLIYDLEGRKLVFMKSTLTHWRTIYEAMEKCFIKLTYLNIDERVKDLVLPIATILEVLGRDWEWIVDFARRSFVEANFVTPETMAFIQTVSEIRKRGRVIGDKYIIPVRTISEIISSVSKTLGTKSEKLSYLRQYIFAGCEVGIISGELCFIGDKKTIDSLVEDFSILEVSLDPPPDDLSLKLSSLPLYLKIIIKGIIKEVEEVNKDGIITIPLSHLRKYFKGTSYYRKSSKDLFKKFSKRLTHPPKILRDLGILNVSLDRDRFEIIFSVDQNKIREIKEEIISKLDNTPRNRS